MTIESPRPTGTLVREDPQEINWGNKVSEWVKGVISQDELLEHYPTYLMSVPERVVKFIETKVAKIVRRQK